MGSLGILDLDGSFFYVKSEVNLPAKTGTKRKGFFRLKKSYKVRNVWERENMSSSEKHKSACLYG